MGYSFYEWVIVLYVVFGIPLLTIRVGQLLDNRLTRIENKLDNL